MYSSPALNRDFLINSLNIVVLVAEYVFADGFEDFNVGVGFEMVFDRCFYLRFWISWSWSVFYFIFILLPSQGNESYD